MDIKHHEPPNALPKQKRIKVSKACYTCRVKKIKCDGLNPCMQCKARQRPCSFSADGVGDPSYPMRPSLQSPKTITPGNSSSPPSLSPRQPLSVLNHTTPPASSITYEKHLLDSTTHRLETLGQSWPGCEYEDSGRNSNAFNSWTYQQQQPPTPPPVSFFLVDLSNELQNDYDIGKCNTTEGRRIVSTESNIQHNLIALYYRHRYQLLPLLPKSTLLALIHHPSPKASISPLLLSILYAHGAQSSPTSSLDADHYATTAKSMVDDYMDTPQISTVIALVLLSLYESNRHGYSCSPCQASAYSAMAFRMCLDLNLHNCCDTNNDSILDIQSTIKALQLRVFWCCYCLDKWQSLCTDRPCMIRNMDIGKNMEMDGKMVLSLEGTSMDHDEQNVMEGLVASIHLAQLSERLLQKSSSSSSGFYADQQLLPFLQRLPASLHWTPLPTPESLSSPASSLYQPIPSHPPHNAIVGQFHLIFNFLHLTLLVRTLLEMTAATSSDQQQQHQRQDYGHLKDNEQAILVLQRCATVATNLTQLTCALTDQSGFILCYRMVAHALMMSVRVHLIQCYSVMQPTGNEQHRVAKHARLMFQRSIRSLRILVQHRVIPGAHTFTILIEKALTTLTLSHQKSDYTSTNHNNSDNNISLNMNENQRHQGPGIPTSTFHYQSQQRSGYLSGAEQSAAEILSSTFNVSPYASNTNTNSHSNSAITKVPVTSSPVQSSHLLTPQLSCATQTASHSEKQQQPLVDVAALYTSATSNPLYHQQIQPHFGYSLPSGKHDEVWALQEQYQLQQQRQQKQRQQQQHQQHHQPSTSSSSSASASQSYGPTSMYSNSLWSSSTSSSTTPTEKKSHGASSAAEALSAPTSTSPSTAEGMPASSPSPSPSSTSLGMASGSPYKSIGLGVYASAHRHHSDVIGQHYPGRNETSMPSTGNNKMDHRPVILNHYGQVLVAATSESPSGTVDI
ncbi:fungal-specific transcription factor domain-domain-containing protein [Absidia repens]|uniref:Fungal-specific transcription factor domain-domain-containing protein n=1 Tax=Absidia repens TaxID=90262 RepID=A0A1X2I808_9FUNG|nr:fungal-specific transcription factor domain-domain-containing protein [Absidia repens]